MLKEVVLDTNILVYISRRQDALWRMKQHLGLPEGLKYHISAVSQGEVESMRKGNQWSLSRIERYEQTTEKFEVVSVRGRTIADAYADLDLFAKNNHPDLTPKNKQAFNMKQNDLWVGATALLLNAPLITTDKDFLPYHGKLINVLYVSPEIFKS